MQNPAVPQPAGAGQRQNSSAVEEARLMTLTVAAVACALILGFLFRVQPVNGSNDGARWNTVWSLTNGRGYVIDDAPYFGIDKVRREGHFYSSKPALMPTVLAGMAWVIRGLTGWAIPAQDWIVIRLILTLINVVPFGIFIYFFSRMLDRYDPGLPARLFCLLSAAFGTYLTAYSIALNNHTQAAIAAFLALYCLVRIVYDGERSWYYFALCGLFTSWTVVSEMMAVVFALAVLGWLFLKAPRRTLTFFVPVAVVMAVAYFYTIWLSTGSLVPYYLKMNTELYQYEGGYWAHPTGIDAANEPKWFYAFNLLLGHHGIFSLTPLFLIGFYGMWKDRKLRGIHLLGLGLTAAMLVFYTFMTNNYGGVAQGARWLFWLIPFWLLGLAPVVARNMPSRRFRWLAMVLLMFSLMSIGYAMTGKKDVGRPGPWSPSWLQLMMSRQGWIDY
jgi:hypothetical protein